MKQNKKNKQTVKRTKYLIKSSEFAHKVEIKKANKKRRKNMKNMFAATRIEISGKKT